MSTSAVPAITTTARKSRRVVAVAAALIIGLIVPLFVVSNPAGATQRRVPLENSIQWSVLKLMNAQRKLHHLPPLRMNSKLQVSARRHNATMARHNSMSHQLRGEANFTRRIQAAGYRWSWAGENIGWNSNRSRAGVLQLQKLMYNERAPYDGHRRNILSRSFREVGVDVYFDHVHHKVWLTTDFGRR